MADNVVITPGVGKTIATDDVGSVHYQRCKISIGADGSASDVASDPSTSALATIDYGHLEIHEGDSFTAQMYQLVSDTSDRTTLGFKTPAGTKMIHMFASGAATAAALFIIREGVTVADNTGATHAAINRRRDSETVTIAVDTSQTPDTAGSITYWAEAAQASVTEDGTVLYQEVIANDKTKGGGAVRGDAEFVLKASTQYVIYLKSLSADDNYHGLVLNWYEHTDVN